MKKEKMVCKLCWSKQYTYANVFCSVILPGNFLVGNFFFQFEVQAQMVMCDLNSFLIESSYLCLFQSHNRVNYFLKGQYYFYLHTLSRNETKDFLDFRTILS